MKKKLIYVVMLLSMLIVSGSVSVMGSIPMGSMHVMQSEYGMDMCRLAVNIDPTHAFMALPPMYGGEAGICLLDWNLYVCWGAELFFESCMDTDEGCLSMMVAIYEICG